MNPKRQRITIAEACGAPWGPVEWFGETKVVLSFNKHVELGPLRWDLPDGRILADDIPDYLSDLNAMHEAEKVLYKQAKRTEYRAALTKVVKATFPPNDVGFTDMISATAAQRAEAFLRTIGKWEEGD